MSVKTASALQLPRPVIWWIEQALILSSAIAIPLYLSMFRYRVGGVLVRFADLFSIITIVLGLLCVPKLRRSLLDKRLLPVYLFAGYILFQGTYLGVGTTAAKESIQLLYVVMFLAITFQIARHYPVQFGHWFLVFLFMSALYTVLYHFLIGHFTRFKLAGDAKYAFGLLSLVSFFMLMSAPCRIYKWIFAFALVAMVLSLERKGLLGFLLSVTVFYTVRYTHLLKLKFHYVVPVLTLVICVFAVFVFNLLSQNMESWVYEQSFLNEKLALYTSNLHRESLLVNGMSAVMENPVWGHGASDIRPVMYQFYSDPRLANSTHNFYLDNLIMYGVAGCALIWLRAIQELLAVIKARDPVALALLLYFVFVVFFMAGGQIVLLFYFTGVLYVRELAGVLWPVREGKF